MFRKYDSDRNEVLDKNELQVLLTEAQKLLGASAASKAEVDLLLQKYDKNSDGFIDKE